MKIILGDNQFNGINHGDHLKARAQKCLFETDQSIQKFVGQAFSTGVHGLSFTTTPRFNNLVKNLVEQLPNIELYPTLPYAHTYAEALNRGGPIAAALEILDAQYPSVKDIFRLLVKRDFTPLFEILLRGELQDLPIQNLKIIFLNNIFTDLLVAWGDKSLVIGYCDAVEKNFCDVKAGFMTMNLPSAASLIHQTDRKPVLCAVINPAGFRMNPNQTDVEDTLREKNFDVWAMSPFASGVNTPKEFWDYTEFASLDLGGVIFGTSKVSRIEEFIGFQNKSSY